MDERRRLVVLESEPALALLLAEQVDEWAVEQAATVDGLFSLLPANAVLLAEGTDHAALAMRLRDARLIGPIFSLTEAGQTVQPPLIGLPRPFRLASFLAKLHSPNGTAVDGAMVGTWRIDSSQRSILGESGQTERLTDKEFEVLSLLLEASPNPVSRERLQTEIWRYHSDVASHTVETHIWRLRQKLELEPGQKPVIVTDAEGYCLV